MKRFLIPAFFVVDANNESQAEAIAAEMKTAANSTPHAMVGNAYLLLDEELPNKEVPIDPEETELPHTYKHCGDECVPDEEMDEINERTRN